MPISSVRDDTRRAVLTTVTGRIDVADIIGHFDSARHGRTLDYIELIDARGATRPFLSPGDIRHVADVVQHSPVVQEFGRRAVVVEGDMTYGLACMFATLLAGHFPIRVFRDRRQAEEWLTSRPSTVDEN